MKRIIVSTLAMATVFALTSGVCSAATGTVATEAFVRSAPSKRSASLGSVKIGAILDYSVAPENSSWLKIQFKGRPGYIGKKMVAASKPTKIAAKAATEASAEKAVAAVVAKPPVFEIVPDVSSEEIRLKEENAKQAGRIKDLEAGVSALKQEIVALKSEVKNRAEQVARYHSMFPYIRVIETVDKEGKDVLLTGIGKARMIESGNQVIVRLEGDTIPAGERIMRGVAKERYLTGGEQNRVYYVLNSQSVKNTTTK